MNGAASACPPPSTRPKLTVRMSLTGRRNLRGDVHVRIVRRLGEGLDDADDLAVDAAESGELHGGVRGRGLRGVLCFFLRDGRGERVLMAM
jgi:hypothetical protein